MTSKIILELPQNTFVDGVMTKELRQEGIHWRDSIKIDKNRHTDIAIGLDTIFVKNNKTKFCIQYVLESLFDIKGEDLE